MAQYQDRYQYSQTAVTPLLDELLSEFSSSSDNFKGRKLTKRDVSLFLHTVLAVGEDDVPLNVLFINSMLIELDKKLSEQMDTILHDTRFRQLESFWRSLRLLVDRIDFKQNIRLFLLHATKDELLEDFEFSAEITQTGYYKHVYSSGYGQFGGDVIAASIGDYYFSSSAQDLKLLQYVSMVGAMAHAPFLTAVAPSFFGLKDFTELSAVSTLSGLFDSPAYSKWRALRDTEDSRYLGLFLPRFLLRSPYSVAENPIRRFHYNENSHKDLENYLWGNAAFLMAICLAGSFAKYRWCPNIIGSDSGGAVKNLPTHYYQAIGGWHGKISTEVLISDRREFELASEGFISMVTRKGSEDVVFYSANSVQKPKKFGHTVEGKTAETNYKLGTQLPYMFIINRLAHYIKVLQRENIGAWKERQDLQRELNTWLKKYIADQENPPADVRSSRPLRAASITVNEVEGEPGWYMATLMVRPHFKYMGANFGLSLISRLDRTT